MEPESILEVSEACGELAANLTNLIVQREPCLDAAAVFAVVAAELDGACRSAYTRFAPLEVPEAGA